MNLRLPIPFLTALVLAALHGNVGLGQCGSLLDSDGVPAESPIYSECNDGSGVFTFFPLTNGTWTDVTVDWGDGSTPEFFAQWNEFVAISHDYVYQSVATYALTFTSPTCTASATLEKSVSVNPAIVVPEGWETGGCAPHTLSFQNGSTNVTPDTEFTWSFDDGTSFSAGSENAGDTVDHLYQAFTAGCQREVTLTATNQCRTREFGMPASVSIDYVNIWDRDNAAIGASEVVLCWPDNTIDVRNLSAKNCLSNGNNDNRKERWDFDGAEGPGGINGIDWRLWSNSNPIPLTFPGVGTYTITLDVENACGIDGTSITVVVREPLSATLNGPTDVCEGEPIAFNAISPEADSFRWDFYGSGQSWIPTSAGNVTWTHNTPGTYEVVVEVGLDGQSASCSTQATHVVEVHGKPAVDLALSDSEGCDNLVVTAEELALEGASTTWVLPDGSTTSGPTTAPISLTTVGTHLFAVTVTDAFGCQNVANEVATVHASPAAAFVAANVCEGMESTFTDTSLPGGGNPIQAWDWTFGEEGTSNIQHPAHSFSGLGTFTVTLEVADAHCTATSTQNLVVNSVPSLDVSSDVVEGCAPLKVLFDAQTEADVVWDFGDGSGGSGPSPTHEFVGDQVNGSTFEVLVTATNDAACSTQEILSVHTLPGARAEMSVPETVCAPVDQTFLNQSEGAVEFIWTFEDGTVSEDVEPSKPYVNVSETIMSETVELVALAATGCHDTTTSILSVRPAANFDLDLDETEACAPFTVFTPAIAGTQNHVWTFNDGTPNSVIPNPVHVFENNTDSALTFTLKLEAENSYGCAGIATKDLVVKPSPSASFTADVQQGCSPLTVTFEENSLRGQSFTWDYGDTTTALGLNGGAHAHTFQVEGTELIAQNVSLTVVAEGGCSDTHVVGIEIYPEVHAVPSGSLESCAPFEADLVATGYESAPGHDIAWVINGNDIVPGPTLQRTFLGQPDVDETVELNLSVTSPYGCQADSTVLAVVRQTPLAKLDLSSQAACAGTEILLVDSSMHADVVTLDWGEGPVTDAPQSLVFENEGFAPAVLELVQTATSAFGCESKSIVSHTVYPKVTAAFLPPAPACAPFTTTLVNVSTNANGTLTWDFGDGSAPSQIPQPVHVFDTPPNEDRTYSVLLEATSIYGCTDSVRHDVVVQSTPVADLVVVNQEGCYPSTVTFANQSDGGDIVEWSYGNGVTSQTTEAIHTFTYYNASSESATYPAMLTVSSSAGCSSEDMVFVEVLPHVEANFQGNTLGCGPLEVSFLNTSAGATHFDWDFGDGSASTSDQATHTFLNAPGRDTTYTVSLVAHSVHGCHDTSEVVVHVLDTPQADFVSDDVQLTFPEATFEFTNVSTAVADADHMWSFGDGQISHDVQPEAHAYDGWGTYNITLEVSNGTCTSVTTSSVQILAPTPTIGFSGEGAGCAPLTVSFDNTSTYASQYRWEFSDGSIRTEEHPVHVFNEPGIYDVTLYVEGYDGTELIEVQTAVVEVYPTADAAFSLSPTRVTAPGQPVYFVNLSDDATSYVWDFGDGTTTDLETPVHEYDVAGLYDISLTANNEWGCQTTYVLEEGVLAEEGGMLVFPTAFTPSASGPSGGFYDRTSYNNDVFYPLHAGVEDYELMIFTKWGEMIFYSDDVNVGWDGYINGKLAPTDVYAWKATASLSNGERMQQVGNVTLLAR